MGFTNYWEAAVLAYTMNGTAMPSPVSHVALFSATPSDAGGGTELVGLGYVRQATPAFTLQDTTSRSDNDVVIQWAAASGAWAQVSWAAFFDASSGGNMIAWGALGTPRTAATGEKLEFDVEALAMILD